MKTSKEKLEEYFSYITCKKVLIWDTSSFSENYIVKHKFVIEDEKIVCWVVRERNNMIGVSYKSEKDAYGRAWRDSWAKIQRTFINKLSL